MESINFNDYSANERQQMLSTFRQKMRAENKKMTAERFFEFFLEKFYKVPKVLKDDIVYCQRAMKEHLQIHQMICEVFERQTDADPVKKDDSLKEIEIVIMKINAECQLLMLQLRDNIAIFCNLFELNAIKLSKEVVKSVVTNQIVPLISDRVYKVVPKQVEERDSQEILIRKYFEIDSESIKEDCGEPDDISVNNDEHDDFAVTNKNTKSTSTFSKTSSSRLCKQEASEKVSVKEDCGEPDDISEDNDELDDFDISNKNTKSTLPFSETSSTTLCKQDASENESVKDDCGEPNDISEDNDELDKNTKSTLPLSETPSTTPFKEQESEERKSTNNTISAAPPQAFATDSTQSVQAPPAAVNVSRVHLRQALQRARHQRLKIEKKVTKPNKSVTVSHALNELIRKQTAQSVSESYRKLNSSEEVFMRMIGLCKPAFRGKVFQHRHPTKKYKRE